MCVLIFPIWTMPRKSDAVWRRAYRKKLRDKGLCPFCGDPVAPGRRTCADHLARNAARDRITREKRRAQWRKEGRCGICGRKLHPFFDKGKATCVSCLDYRRVVVGYG